jgi:hypothetical protein
MDAAFIFVVSLVTAAAVIDRVTIGRMVRWQSHLITAQRTRIELQQEQIDNQAATIQDLFDEVN